MLRIRDWTTFPGARKRREGPGSAQEFREDHLIPAMRKSGTERLTIDLSGCAGFAASFLDELFGGLSGMKTEDGEIIPLPHVVCDDDEYAVSKVREHLKRQEP